MAVYIWEGRNRAGDRKSGEVTAKNRQVAIERLVADGIFVKSIKAKGIEINIKFFKKKIKDKDVALFTKGFSVMVGSGLPILDSLDILADQEKNPEFKKVIMDIYSKVEGGSTLTFALSEHKKVFSDLYVSLIESGEKSGTLDDVAKRLSNYMEKTIALKRKIRGAMIYPSMVSAVAVGVVTLILTIVIPSFASLYESSGMLLPLPTRIVIQMSELLRSYFLYIAGALVAIFLIFRYLYRKSYKFRKFVDKMILNIPIFGLLIKKASIARFARTLGSLMKSGVDILEGFDIIAKIAGNVVIQENLLSIREDVASGSSVAEPLRKSELFPSMVAHMVSVGEKTGRLDEMLEKTADYYEAEVDNTVNNLSTLIEPIIIVVLGVIIGFIVIAMYLPIFKLGEVIK